MFSVNSLFKPARKSQVIRSQLKYFASNEKSMEKPVNWENAKPFKDIPGPKSKFEMLKLTGPFGKYHNVPLTELINGFRRDYGEISKLPGMFGKRTTVLTFSPEDIELVMRTEGKFPIRKPFETVEYFRKKHRPELYPRGAGMTITHGQEWYDFRSKVQQVLMQPRSAKFYIPEFDEVARDFVEKIRYIRDENNETPEDFFENCKEWALESLGFIALDKRLGLIENPEASKLYKLVKRYFETTYKYDVTPSPWRVCPKLHPGFMRAMSFYEEMALEIRKFITEACERYEKNPTPNINEAGVLERLVNIDKTIGCTTAEDMVMAGIDTTSSALVGILYNLARNPEKQEKLRKEVLQILPERHDKLTASSFNSIPYMRSVLKESMRVSPVTVGNQRAVSQDLVLQGYQIPKGTEVMLSNGTLSLDENHFKRSKEFIPERWLKDNNDPECPHAKDAHPFIYLPFGFGSRMCIGRRFTELELQVVTARILREFRLEWHQPDLKTKSITINLPDGPLKFKVIDI